MIVQIRAFGHAQKEVVEREWIGARGFEGKLGTFLGAGLPSRLRLHLALSRRSRAEQ
jgi:hypothetical protein